MAIIGWYYQHTNGDLIYKWDLSVTKADLVETPFSVAVWPLDEEDRTTAWAILVEATAMGAKPERVQALVEKWGCDDDDAQHYADRIGLVLKQDGDQWCAHREDFENLAESPAGFGDSCLTAMADLCKNLNYKHSKLGWGNGFAQLVK